MQTDSTAPKTIDEYIAGFPQEGQEIMTKIRMTISTAAPEKHETTRYRLTTFTLIAKTYRYRRPRKI